MADSGKTPALLPIGPRDHPDPIMVWQKKELRAILEYAERCVAAERAAERERCAAVVRYWLAGHAPSEGSYEARCIAHLLDGRPASAWAERA